MRNQNPADQTDIAQDNKHDLRSALPLQEPHQDLRQWMADNADIVGRFLASNLGR